MDRLGHLKKSLKTGLPKLRLFGLTARIYLSGKTVTRIRSQVSSRWLRIREAIRGLPVPPPELLFLVAGTTDVRWFLHSGKLAFESIRDALRRCEIAPDNFSKALDFGCGCGRVLRYWRSVKGVKMFGADYNPDLIVWCKSNLPFASCCVNDLSPPLGYCDNEFDFVYALSVFTHLPEQLQLSWMDELRRVLKPGAHLLITTHGRAYLDHLSAAELKVYQNNQLVVKDAESAGSNRCGAFHPEQYVRNKLAGGFAVLDFIPEGAKGNPRQDLYLLQKKLDGDSN